MTLVANGPPSTNGDTKGPPKSSVVIMQGTYLFSQLDNH